MRGSKRSHTGGGQVRPLTLHERDHREKPERHLPGGEGGKERAACFCVGMAPGSYAPHLSGAKRIKYVHGRDHREKPERHQPGGEERDERAACFCVGIAPGS